MASAESIGSATMLPDRSIVLQLRAIGAGAIGDALFTYRPSDANYDVVLAHLGTDMKPGDERHVAPFA